jgi:hypothetical protein
LKLKPPIHSHCQLFAFGATITNLLVFLALMEVPGLKNLGAFFSVAITMILSQHLVLTTAGSYSRKSISPPDHIVSSIVFQSGNPRSRSSDVSSDDEMKERSKSREFSQRRTVGGSTMTTGPPRTFNGKRVPSTRAGLHRSDSRLDRIELGGIRVHTETEIHRSGGMDSITDLPTTDSRPWSVAESIKKSGDGRKMSDSYEDLSDLNHDQYVDKLERERMGAHAV